MRLNITPSAGSGGRRITDRQIQVLNAVNEKGSINAAAAHLQISPPVAYRHIRELEDIIGENVLRTSPRGSVLTECGVNILSTLSSANEKLSSERRFTVSCSPVTEELLTSVISSAGIDADLLVSDDSMNVRHLRKGETDVVILDDPVHVFDDDSLQWQEIAQMSMVHADKGSSYIRYRYGAQRIAYRHLDASGKRYTVDAETLSLNDLINSGKSFFVDEVLLMRKGIRLHSSTDPALLRHSILAVFRKSTDTVEKLVSELLKRK